MKLTEERCHPIPKGSAPLPAGDASAMAREVPAWSLKGDMIEREFRFKDFHGSMEFVEKVAAIANEQDHHPDIWISYNKVRLILSTHSIGGLTTNDFIVAALVDRMSSAA